MATHLFRVTSRNPRKTVVYATIDYAIRRGDLARQIGAHSCTFDETTETMTVQTDRDATETLVNLNFEFKGSGSTCEWRHA